MGDGGERKRARESEREEARVASDFVINFPKCFIASWSEYE